MTLRHLEWLIEELVPDPEVILYEILPYSPAEADQIVQCLFDLAGFDVRQTSDNPARAALVRQAFRFIVEAAGARQAQLDLHELERDLGKPTWRDRLRDLRNDRRQFTRVVRNKSARAALHWALVDSGFDIRAGPRWLHYLRDRPDVLRETIIRALEEPRLQDCGGRPERLDRVLLIVGVSRAYELLTGEALGRNVTSETKTRQGGTSTGPGFQLASICLKPLDPKITDHAVDWAIRRCSGKANGLKLSY